MNIERITQGRTDLVLEMLRSGGSPETTDSSGTPLIRWCAYYGDVTAVATLLDAGAPTHLLGPNLDLNGAAYHGHWQLCEFLLELGADPNFPLAGTGETPLHAATSTPGRPEFELVVEVLLAAGADPDARTIPGIETGSYMRDARTAGETPLHRAAAFASAKTIGQLLSGGATIDARDTRGDSPLSWASIHCRPDSILRLLLFGEHRIHPDRNSTSDHGAGVSAMQRHLLGRPHGDES